MLVGIGDAAVVLFFKGVFRRILVWIPALPEGFDKLLARFVRIEVEECAALFRRDNVRYVFVEPLLVRGIEFVVEVLVFLLAFFSGFLRVLCCRLGVFLLLLRNTGMGNGDAHQSTCKHGNYRHLIQPAHMDTFTLFG